MHPTMMIALANEVERERQQERQRLAVRSQVLAAHRLRSRGAWLASAYAARLSVGISLRPRLS